jgi:uncharacterized NAD(P)/FAD-binding protein YdhS
MQTIIIVGGGLSSRLLSLNLMRLSRKRKITIVIIEKNRLDRLGDAFSTGEDYHLLNVTVNKVSNYPDEPNHFLHWLIREEYNYNENSYVSRKIYKKYVKAIFENECRSQSQNINIILVNGQVTQINVHEKFVVVDRMKLIKGDKVVLAIGNFKPSEIHLDNNTYLNNQGYHPSAWDDGLYDNFDEDEPILIIGSGLTMVDVLLSLNARNHRGKIIVISAHGYLPVSHTFHTGYTSYYNEISNAENLLEIFRIVRMHIQKAALSNIAWHAVIDALREDTQKIWGKLNSNDKKSFFEHLRHIWGVARHRMPPENAAVITDLFNAKRVILSAGRITKITSIDNKRFSVLYRERTTGKIISETVSHIINCMGPAANLKNIKDPLLCSLFSDSICDSDTLGLGINSLADGTVIDRNGNFSDYLFVLGPPARGVLWESTAVPEIRIQSCEIAKLLTNSVF